MAEPSNEPEADRRPGWSTMVLALAVYAGALAIATWPAFKGLSQTLPGPLNDPLQHLWIIRWCRACLLGGRSPYLCPDIQYPVGAPLGLFSPMTVPTAIYLVLATITNNDILIYNTIWLLGMLGTGLGIFLLTWFVVRDRLAAVFAGLAAMISTPMLMHGQGHLELIQLGSVPLFLIAWIRFVDRPTLGRLLTSWATFIFVSACAAYFVVLTPVLAVWYLVWTCFRSWKDGSGVRACLRSRIIPLLGFAGMVAPVMLVLFSPQLWAARHGFTMTRSRSEFEWYGAPFWSYLVPTRWHALGRAFAALSGQAPSNLATNTIEAAAYLGVVPIALIVYAIVRRARFPRSGYWWSVFVVLVVLSMGATLRLGKIRIDLPCSWLWTIVPPFRLIRVPARFNLLACVVAAVLAASGLKDLLGRLSRGRRVVFWCVMVGLTIADLTVSPFVTSRIPEIPAGYAALDRLSGRSAILDAPIVFSASAHPLSAICGYWQSIRNGRTTAGYSGVANQPFDHLMVDGSPFGARELADPAFLADPARQSFGVVAEIPFLDYTWLYLTAHRVDHVVLHHWPGSVHQYLVRLDRIQAVLRDARIFSDASTTVFARARLHKPTGPVILCGEGWRTRFGWPDPPNRVSFPKARLIAYSPDPGLDLRFELIASSFRVPRNVRLLFGTVELARWRIDPGDRKAYTSPSFRLPEGVHEMTLESEGASQPKSHREAFDNALTPYSLRVHEIRLRAAGDSGDAPARAESRGD